MSRDIEIIAEALVDAADHWSDENWPYGTSAIGFCEKHKEAIAEARNICDQEKQKTPIQ